MITKLSSIAQAKVKFHFSNGATISVIWGPASYSDNHDVFYPGIGSPLQNVFGDGATNLESSTYEVMAMGDNQEFIVWFTEKYGDNPAGYIPVPQLLGMLRACDAWASEVKGIEA